MIVVDFYAGNTFNDPGPENCNPKRCGGALIQFSEAVLVFGSPAIDVLGKGIIECIEGCSNTEPSSYIILSGKAWIEAGDTIVESRIIQLDGAFITDVAGNQIDTYDLSTAITARASDFAMVQGPTPVPTPVPAPVSNQNPYVVNLDYEGTTVNLHINEPVDVQANSHSDVSINVRLEDGTEVQGHCIAPCSGSDALLSFDVPELTSGAIAKSFVIAQNASIRDSEGGNIFPDFEELTLDLIPRIEEVKMPQGSPDGTWPATRLIHVYFSREVWKDATELYIRTNTGVLIPCDVEICLYGPKGKGNLIFFGWDIDDVENAPIFKDGDFVDAIVSDGQLVGTNGLRADLTFEPAIFGR